MIIISVLVSILFIPAAVLFYFCFLMTIMLLADGGVKEGAVLKVFLEGKRRELIIIYIKFFLGGAICTLIPVLWFCYI